MDVCYRDSNVVVDTSVGYNEYSVWFWARSLIDILKMVEMSSSGFSIFVFYYVKRAAIRKSIYKVKTRKKFFVHNSPYAGKLSLFQV